MKTIQKYKLDNILYGDSTVNIPEYGKVLSVFATDNEVYVWVFVNTDEILIPRTFKAFKTGDNLDDTDTVGVYVGTVSIFQGSRHIFEQLNF